MYRNIPWIAIDEVGWLWTTKNPQAFIHAGLMDFLGLPKTVKWCWREESNLRPTRYECVALPTELLQRKRDDYKGRATTREHQQGVERLLRPA